MSNLIGKYMPERSRVASNPGGCECVQCGCTFIGEEWHQLCSVCLSENRCPQCGALNNYKHDHRADNSGLDDGPYLKGFQPRKKPAPKTTEEMASIRARAWETRREKYGKYGHR